MMNLTHADQYRQPRRHEFTRPEPVEWLEEYKWAGWRQPDLTLPGRMRLPSLPKQPRDLIPPLPDPTRMKSGRDDFKSMIPKLPEPMKMWKQQMEGISYFNTTSTPWPSIPKSEEWKVELKAILARLSVVGHRYPFRFEWSGAYFGSGSRWPGVIDVKMLCWDRHHPQQEIWVSNPLPIPNEITLETITEAVRTSVKFLMQHEVDECLHFDKVRKWDPHPPPPPMRWNGIMWSEL